MSILLANAKGAQNALTPQRRTIVQHPLTNVQQWSKGVSAAPKSVEPGTTTVIDVKFNSTKFEQENAHYLKYDVKNTSSTVSVTFKNGALNHFSKIKLIPNNSDKAIEIDNLASVKAIVAHYYLNNYGLDIYEGLNFIRNEYNTFNGITVGTSSSTTFYYDLAPFIDFAKTTIKGQISSLRIELEATPEQANVGKSGYLFASSSDAMSYTKDTISFQNINYIRNYSVISNPNLLVGFLSTDKPVKKINWKAFEYVKYTGSWNKSDGDSFSCKLSDIRECHNIQHVEVIWRPTVTAYNSAECCKEYSGHHWIGWKWRQLNTSDEYELDMTDQRMLKNHEIQQYHNEYGRFKQLPPEIFNDASNLMTKYYLPMTRIDFDYLQSMVDHEIVRNISSINQDYDLTFYANGEAGDSGQLVFRIITAEELEFDKKTGQLTKVN